MPVARSVQLSQIRIEYFEHGHGPIRVVLVHGFEASARIWTEVQEALPADRYTSIAINNRGAGQSDAPTDDNAYGVEPFAADVHELLLAIGWKGFTLVGHSMGGATVVRFALDHPHYLHGLMLLNPANPDGRKGTPAEVELRMKAFLIARRARLAAPAKKISDNAPSLAPGSTPDWRALLDADMANAPECRLRGSLRSMHAIRMGDELASLSMPALLVCGDLDDLIPLPDMLATWGKLPPGSGLHVWHGVGHSPNLECPQTLAALLRQFIETRSRAPGAHEPQLLHASATPSQ